MDIQNRLAELRQKRGLSAAELARQAGVSRQTIYAMEAGSYMPNTGVALRLARSLECRVEEIFTLLDPAAAVPTLPTEQASLLPGSGTLVPGQPVQLCQVDRRLLASPPWPLPWYLPASDAVIAPGEPVEGKAKVQLFRDLEELSRRLLIAGCDPGISVLERHMRAAGVELVLAHRNSSQSLELLKQGSLHAAGTHLRDTQTGQSNVPAVSRLFTPKSVAVISFAVWEEGILSARGNPKSIRTAADLVRPDVRIVNREPGSGSRLLLDSQLSGLGAQPEQVNGFTDLAPGHLAAAWRVQSGQADACLATRAAARLYGLHFEPLVSERYDLVFRRSHLGLPAVQILLETLNRASFRRELESLGGYETHTTGEQLL